MSRRLTIAATSDCRDVPPLARPRPFLAPIGLVLILLTTILVYLPSLRGGKLWDDDAHIPQPHLQSLQGLHRIWFEPGSTQQHYPVLFTAFWIEHKLWGETMLGYHLVNLVLHLLAVTLVYLNLRQLEVPGALLAAAIFALHPVMVESVAWVTEQKNTLSTVFYLAAMFAYVKFDESRRRSSYVLATILFALALLSKTVTVTLPAALLVIFWWKRGTLSWRRDVLPLVPWFVMSLLAGALTSWAERNLLGAEGDDFSLTFVQSILVAGRAICFYIGKLVWPTNLIFIYPRWQVDPAAWWQWLFPVAVLGVTAGLWAIRRITRGPIAGWLYFCGTLFPVLGFFNVYFFLYSYVNDHFQYLASLGLITLFSAGIVQLLVRIPLPALAGSALCVLLVSILATLSWQQSLMYADVVTLYRTTLERNPNSWMTHNNLGITLQANGNVEEAIEHFRTAISIRPNHANAHANLGSAFADAGQFQQAFVHLHEALRLQPDHVAGHINLGDALVRAGRPQEAIGEFEQALRIRPDDPLVEYNLARALAGSGHIDKALAHYREAVRLRPDFHKAHVDFGALLTRSGHPQKAIGSEFYAALDVNPDDPVALNNLAVALIKVGSFPQAIEHIEHALKFEPNNPDAHSHMGIAWAQLGKIPQAIEQFRRVLELDPNHITAQHNLGVLLAKSGKPDEAISHFQREISLQPTAAAYSGLAQAQALAGLVDEANTAANRAIEIARANGDEATARQVEELFPHHQIQPERTEPATKLQPQSDPK